MMEGIILSCYLLLRIKSVILYFSDSYFILLIIFFFFFQRDVDCISCNKPVIQKVDKDSYKDINAFPATKSVRSYLTYELDQIRKQQRQ